MNRVRASSLACLFVLAGCAGGPVGNGHVPQPAKTVETARYLGKWFELGRYENGFEKDCEAVTAEYGLLPNGEIRVRNTCRQGSVDGKAKISEGRAKVADAGSNAKLKVSFFGPFYIGDYWVLDHAEDYSWSIVGEPSGRFLWILSRTAKPSEGVRSDLVKRATNLGYDTSLLRWTKQP